MSTEDQNLICLAILISACYIDRSRHRKKKQMLPFIDNLLGLFNIYDGHLLVFKMLALDMEIHLENGVREIHKRWQAILKDRINVATVQVSSEPKLELRGAKEDIKYPCVVWITSRSKMLIRKVWDAVVGSRGTRPTSFSSKRTNVTLDRIDSFLVVIYWCKRSRYKIVREFMENIIEQKRC